MICGKINAQDGPGEIQLISMRENSKIDSLFAKRTHLLHADSNTRGVDLELAKMGIKFPVKVSF